MTPNKEWMSLFNDRFNEKYKTGVEHFLNYAFLMAGSDKHILCPCVKCKNDEFKSREEVKTDLNVNGIMKNYTTWYYHGEKLEGSALDDETINGSDEEMEDILTDLYHGLDGCDSKVLEDNSTCQSKNREEPNKEAKTFYRLLKESEEPSYPGSKSSKLCILVHLLHIKSVGRWSNESFNMLLQLLKRLLPSGSTLPESYYDAKKIIKDLGLSYERIDACKNDCMLYWKEKKESDICEVCGASRWKEDSRSSGEDKVGHNGKKLAIKTLRYFPLKPRLQRLFM